MLVLYGDICDVNISTNDSTALNCYGTFLLFSLVEIFVGGNTAVEAFDFNSGNRWIKQILKCWQCFGENSIWKKPASHQAKQN